MISVILAAGKGTRMKSELPKVIHKVNGVPMLQKVSDVLEKTGVHKKIFILGHMKEKVLSVMGDIDYIEQDEQLGTGHAVLIAKDEILKSKQASDSRSRQRGSQRHRHDCPLSCSRPRRESLKSF